MKNHNHAISWLIFLLLSLAPINTLQALIVGKNTDKAEVAIYCPNSITCTTNDFESCELGPNSKNWQSNDPVKRGTYNLVQVNAPYLSNSNLISNCLYESRTAKQAKFTLNANVDANLEAFPIARSKWLVMNDKAYCTTTTSSTKSCPLRNKSALIIHNIDLKNGVYAAIHQSRISKKTNANEYMNIAFDAALSGCSSEKMCQIDIMADNGEIYGSITVNMDSNMRIVTITAAHPNEISVQQVTGFNAVQIAYYSNPTMQKSK